MLMECQIQHKTREPTLLDVDHPTPSPDFVSRFSTPRRSPLYNSHIATSIHVPLLNEHAWESPAFLKRTVFFDESYDPFEEEADDFPDNDRRKRSKLGRGSGQWRIVDRTPSPEKESEIDRLKIAGLARPHAEEDAQAPPLNIESAETIEDGGEINSRGQKIHEDPGQVNENGLDIVPQTSPSMEVGLENEEPKHSLPEEADTDSPRSESSISVQSKSRQGSLSGADGNSVLENSDEATFSAVTTEFGLDGSMLSHVKKPLKTLAHRKSAVDEPDQSTADSEIDHSRELNLILPSEQDVDQWDKGSNREPNTIEESVHEFQFLNDHSSAQSDSRGHENEAPNELLSEPLHESYYYETNHQGNESLPEISMVSSHAETQSPVKVNALETTLDEALFHERSRSTESIEASQYVEVRAPGYERAAADEGDMTVSVGSASSSEQSELQSIEGGLESEGEEDVRPVEVRDTRVEIIDLESDDEESEQSEQLSPYFSDRTPSIASDANIIGQPKTWSLNESTSTRSTPDNLQAPEPHSQAFGQSYPEQGDRIDSHSDSGVEGTLQQKLQEEHASPELHREVPSSIEDLIVNSRHPDAETSPRPHQAVELEKLSDHREAPDFRPPEEVSEIQQPSLHSISPVRDFERSAHVEVDVEQEAGNSSIQLPSTVPDSVQIQEQIFKSQLMTPDATQRTSFTSQQSFASLQTASNDNTLPTPRLTQGNSAGLVIPTTPSVLSEPLVVEDSVPASAHDNSKVEEGPEEISKSLQKAPTLIEKLKEMRRLSSQTPQRMGDANAIRTWFAPIRSNQALRNTKAENEVESLSEGDRKISKLKGPSKWQTPGKQKSLAKSFVRSPPQHEDVDSVASSPGFLQSSQPPPSGFRTNLSYYVPLVTLQSHFSQSVDVLAMALTTTQVTRATIGPRDYNQTIYITDPSLNSLKAPITMAQIFRSHNRCFPIIEKGDAVLLRDFKVQSFQRQPALLSTQSSAWAVFSTDAAVQIRGPPVEFGAEERGFARGLRRWWDGLDHDAKRRLDQAVPNDKEEQLKERSKSPVAVKKEDLQNNSAMRKELIEGLGINLPGSHGKRNEAALALNEPSPGPAAVLESTEPPLRVLRPRGTRGMPDKSESPTKAINRRSGTVFTGGVGEPESE